MKIDSSRLALQESTRQYERVKKMDTIKAGMRVWFGDTAKIKADTLKSLYKELDATERYYSQIIADKNTALFKANRLVKNIECKTPNVWLLIGIIVVTGILGGLAGPRFSLLTDVSGEGSEAVSAVERAVNRSEVALQQLQGSVANNVAMQADMGLTQAISVASDSLQEAKEAADELKKLQEKRFAFLVFGLIAASLSFVALSIFNSKILDFNTVIDYFIFAGYSLLGAVFAKKWIQQLYDLISKK